jgi:preprotein translocase subunit SecE
MAVPQAQNPEQSFVARVSHWPQEIRNYFEDLKKEMRLVSWPTWSQVRATTAVVVAAVFIFAFYFWLVDMGVGFLMQKLFAYVGKQ